MSPRPSRGRWVAALLALALAVGAVSLPVWVRGTGVSALSGEVPVAVSGAAAAPVVPATALVLAAAGAAVALAGRLGRWFVAAVVLVGGLALVLAGAAVLVDPAGPALAAAADLTGVDHLTGLASPTPGPWLTVALGGATAVAAVALARSSAGWGAPSARHEGAAAVAPPPAGGPAPAAPDERADWDALSRGADPSREP